MAAPGVQVSSATLAEDLDSQSLLPASASTSSSDTQGCGCLSSGSAETVTSTGKCAFLPIATHQDLELSKGELALLPCLETTGPRHTHPPALGGKGNTEAGFADQTLFHCCLTMNSSEPRFSCLGNGAESSQLIIRSGRHKMKVMFVNC